MGFADKNRIIQREMNILLRTIAISDFYCIVVETLKNRKYH